MATVGLVCISLFAALFARLWFLQVMNAGTYDKAADVAAYREINVPAPRGRILDRNGKVLVDNKSYLVVAVDTQVLAKAKSPDTVLSRLADLLNQYMAPTTPYNTDILREKLRNKQVSPYKPVPVATNAPQQLEIYLSEHPDKFPSVSVERETLRTYPYGTLAAQVLGYVGPITDSQWKAHEHDKVPYQKDDDIGRAGVEATFEKYLRGTPGRKVFEVDRVGRVVRTVSETPPIPGDDVYLTIDANAQAVAERGVANGLESARKTCNRVGCPPAPAGSMVVLDPRNGQVLALASNPTYDPSLFVPAISTRDYQKLTEPDSHYPFTDRAIAGQYPPGSTFKLVTSIAGLRAGVIDPSFTYGDSGQYKIIGCQNDSQGCIKYGDQKTAHGNVNLTRALTVSSDTYYYRIGDLLWRSSDHKEAIQDVAREFGFGSKTGIELPDEQAGLVGTPELLKRLHDKYAAAYPYGNQWYSGNNANLAIGQDVINATPLQLANAYATFANNGTRYQPTLLLKVTKFRTGSVVMTQQPKVAGKVDLPAPWRDAMLAGFDGVTTSGEGTATGAFANAGYPMANLPVAGKTGTSQNNTAKNEQDNSLFVGFGPSSNAQYVAAAVFEQAGYGAAIAAPAVVDFFLPLAQHGTFPEVTPVDSTDTAAAPSAQAGGAAQSISADTTTTGSGGQTTGDTIAPLQSSDPNGTRTSTSLPATSGSGG
ncbi:MAG TPA: penicillin-binding protein 2 [Acidimicrobiales bacterium]|nr:penicillin-binding protein 2 [Acidimicrobiales bacterium]